MLVAKRLPSGDLHEALHELLPLIREFLPSHVRFRERDAEVAYSIPISRS